MRGGNGSGKRLIARHNRSLCGAMRRCKNSRPLRFCENSMTSGGKRPTFPRTEIPAAQICMRTSALYNCNGGIAVLLDKSRPHLFTYSPSIILEGKTMLSPRRSILALILCGFAALVSTAAPSPANGQAWPQHPVKFVIPLGPGSGVDITARIFADKLSAKLGQPVIVENRPGGDAFIAIMAVIGARDDHVLLFAPASTFTAHPLLHEKLPYDLKEEH